jgi:hypothetical protein
MRLERRHVAAFRAAVRHASSQVRDVVLANGADAPWTLQAHARVMRQLRAISRKLGRELSLAAERAALAAAEQGSRRYPETLAALASGALGQRLPTPRVDLARARTVAHEEVAARTHDVGARTGEDVGQVAVGASFLEARRTESTSTSTGAVAAAVAAAFLLRARSNGERVLITETTAGYAVGGRSAAVQLRERMPRLRKAWDATLDLRVCATCAGLHHVVVDSDQPFPGGFDDAPAHANCRCATMPWLSEWTDILDAIGAGPGTRSGVLGAVETRLTSFAETVGGRHAPDKYRPAAARPA